MFYRHKFGLFSHPLKDGFSILNINHARSLNLLIVAYT